MRELPERAGSAFAATSASVVLIVVRFCLFSGIGRHLFVINNNVYTKPTLSELRCKVTAFSRPT